MTEQLIWQFVFWTFTIGSIAIGLAWVAAIEALDRHQERLAAEHRAKRRAARFRNLNR